MELLGLLAQFGSPAVMAGLLYLLHRDALKAFRDEMKEERKAHRTQLSEDREACDSRNAELLSSITLNFSQLKADSQLLRHAIHDLARAAAIKHALSEGPDQKEEK